MYLAPRSTANSINTILCHIVLRNDLLITVITVLVYFEDLHWFVFFGPRSTTLCEMIIDAKKGVLCFANVYFVVLEKQYIYVNWSGWGSVHRIGRYWEILGDIWRWLSNCPMKSTKIVIVCGCSGQPTNPNGSI